MKFAKKRETTARDQRDLAPRRWGSGDWWTRTRTASGVSRCAALPRRASRETSWALAHFADSTVGRKKTDRGSLLGSFDGGRCVRRSSRPIEFLFFVDLTSNKRREAAAGGTRSGLSRGDRRAIARGSASIDRIQPQTRVSASTNALEYSRRGAREAPICANVLARRKTIDATSPRDRRPRSTLTARSTLGSLSTTDSLPRR